MPEPPLRRSLGLRSAILVTVGSVIGSGIFLKPLEVAQSLPDAGWIFGCWIGLGILCLMGALAYAELGAMLPEAGGQYAFLREGFGRFPAFLYGWCFFLVINTGTVAALAVAFAESLGRLVPLGATAHGAVALAMILALALVNHFGVQVGAWLQDVSTLVKILMLAGIAAGAFLLGRGEGGPAVVAAGEAPAVPGLATGLAAAGVAIFWAYEGWYQLPYSAAEMKHPERDLPRGLVYGMGILIVLYVITNLGYLHVVPQAEMRGLEKAVDVPLVTLSRTFGAGVARLLPLMICISVLGAANPNFLSSPRAFYAMARDGLLVRPLMHVHARYRTPVTAIWTQAVWAGALVLVLQTFRDITEYVVFASLLFYALTVASVIVLRRTAPQLPRPFRCPGYPVTPLLYIAIVLAVEVLILSSAANRRNALIGLAILAAGVPAYLWLRSRSRVPVP